MVLLVCSIVFGLCVMAIVVAGIIYVVKKQS